MVSTSSRFISAIAKSSAASSGHSATIPPHGSMTADMPKYFTWLFPKFSVPPRLTATTKHWFSMARARESMRQCSDRGCGKAAPLYGNTKGHCVIRKMDRGNGCPAENRAALPLFIPGAGSGAHRPVFSIVCPGGRACQWRNRPAPGGQKGVLLFEISVDNPAGL